jgi:LysR family glycine cleavage system transcriptional activator
MTTNQRLPPIASIRAFEAVVRHMNFTRAAEELGITQAAVSYQIRLLEERMGSALFVREPRRLTLTASGVRLASPVKDAFELLRAAFESFDAESETVLSLSIAETIASNWLVPRLGSFQLEHPSIAVRLEASDELVDFDRTARDVGIRTGRGSWPGLEAQYLFPMELAPVCTPALLQQFGPLREPKDLLKLPLISPSDPNWGIWFASAGVADVNLTSLRGLDLQVQHLEGKAALAGQGVALVNPLFFANELRSGGLVRAVDLTASSELSYWLVYPKKRRTRAKVRAFRDWLMSQASSAKAETSGI